MVKEISLEVLSVDLRAMLVYLKEDPPEDQKSRLIIESLAEKIKTALETDIEGMAFLKLSLASEKECKEAILFKRLTRAIEKSFAKTAEAMKTLDKLWPPPWEEKNT